MLIAAIACGTGGCHNLRSQLSAMTGSATTPSGPTDGSSAKPKMLQYYKGQSPILDHLGQRQERPGPDPARGVSAPRFDWTRHSGELGGAFGTGSTARRQRAGW